MSVTQLMDPSGERRITPQSAKQQSATFAAVKHLQFARAAKDLVKIFLIAVKLHCQSVVEMSHSVGGFDLKFTYRTSWKAERRFLARSIDVIPVTWTRGRRQDASTKEVFLEVWYRSLDELNLRAADPNAFVVALAVAKDYRKHPHDFDHFVGLFRVVSTGTFLSDESIETKVLERVRAKEMAAA